LDDDFWQKLQKRGCATSFASLQVFCGRELSIRNWSRVAQRVALKGACLIRHRSHHYLKLQARILRSEVGVSFDWPSKHFVIKVYADVSD
jgi:hypothetical protein